MQSITQKQKLKHLSTQQANAHGVGKKLKIQDVGVQQNAETNLRDTQKPNEKYAFRTNFNEWDYKFPRSYKERYGVEYTPTKKSLWAKALFYVYVKFFRRYFCIYINRK